MAAKKYDRKELEKLRKQGLTWKEVAEQVNGSHNYIRRIMAWVLCAKMCAVCGNEFVCVQGTTIYCSDVCTQRAFRLRHRQKVNTSESHDTNTNYYRTERENSNCNE